MEKLINRYQNLTRSFNALQRTCNLFKRRYETADLDKRDAYLEIVEIRNMTSRVYDEEKAQKICLAIFEHITVLEKVVASIKFE